MVEANEILSQDDYPTFISEFNVKVTFSAEIDVEQKPRKIAFRESVPVLTEKAYKPLMFSTYRSLSPQERVITGFKEELGLTIETRIIAVPKTISPP